MKSASEKAYAYARSLERSRVYGRTTTRYADGVTRRKEWGGFAWFDLPAHAVAKMPDGERVQRPVAPVLDDVPNDHVDRVAWRGDDGRGTIPRTLDWDGASIPWDAYAEAPEPEPANWREAVRRMARDAYLLTREIDSLGTAILLVSGVNPGAADDMQKRTEAFAKRRDALIESIGRICADFEYTGTKADSDFADIVDRRWISYARNIVEEHRAAEREAAALARELRIESSEERQQRRALTAAKTAERAQRKAEQRRYEREAELAHLDRHLLCDHPMTRWHVFAAADMVESRALHAAIRWPVDEENEQWRVVYRAWTKYIRENDEQYKRHGEEYGSGKNLRL